MTAKQTAYSFRLRINLPPTCRLMHDQAKVTVARIDERHDLVLSAGRRDTTISDTDRLILRVNGIPSEQRACELGERCSDALILAMAALRMAADLGDRAPHGRFFRAGLDLLSETTRNRFLNDIHGLMVFKSLPDPSFASIGTGTVRIRHEFSKFRDKLASALQTKPVFSDQERLTFTLYSSSFFQSTSDTRFLLLVMAVEALLDPPLRQGAAAEHVDALITQTKNNSALSEATRNSLLGSLKWLRSESINQTGRRFARERLGTGDFEGRSAPDFWSYCYGLRSNLVHGVQPIPTREEIARAAAGMEVFVSEAIAKPYSRIST